jgi:hypothetical protein
VGSKGGSGKGDKVAEGREGKGGTIRSIDKAGVWRGREGKGEEPRREGAWGEKERRWAGEETMVYTCRGSVP